LYFGIGEIVYAIVVSFAYGDGTPVDQFISTWTLLLNLPLGIVTIVFSENGTLPDRECAFAAISSFLTFVGFHFLLVSALFPREVLWKGPNIYVGAISLFIGLPLFLKVNSFVPRRGNIIGIILGQLAFH